MESVLMAITVVSITIGTIFFVLGVLKYLRLPDVYTRFHTTEKISVFGVVLLFFATVVRTRVSWGHVHGIGCVPFDGRTGHHPHRLFGDSPNWPPPGIRRTG